VTISNTERNTIVLKALKSDLENYLPVS